MARKITVLGENRQVKKAVAHCLVRKASHRWEIYNFSIVARPIKEYRPEVKGLEVVTVQMFDFDYPEQSYDPKLSLIPAMRYPQILAPRNLESF